MDDLREKVLQLVRINGPVLPAQISRSINTNILFASAILSELVSNKQILLSNTKIGGSPVYYVKGQESRLELLYKHLSEKPKKAFDLIKEKKILKDSDCEPWQRVALREIKDFATPFYFKINDKDEIFWRWYLTSEEEANSLINSKYKVIKEIEKEKPKIIKIFTIDKIKDYFKENKINIVNEEIIKKNKEVNYIADVPSEVGIIRFFIKVNIKKRIDEGDLSLAVNESRNKPVLFLTNGSLTKKAKDYIEKRLKGQLIFKNI